MDIHRRSGTLGKQRKEKLSRDQADIVTLEKTRSSTSQNFADPIKGVFNHGRAVLFSKFQAVQCLVTVLE